MQQIKCKRLTIKHGDCRRCLPTLSLSLPQSLALRASLEAEEKGTMGNEWSEVRGSEGSARSRRCRSCENFAEARILNTVSLQTEERRVGVVVFLFVWVLLWFRCAPSATSVSLMHAAHDERHNYRYVYATIAIFCLLHVQPRWLAVNAVRERCSVAVSFAQTAESSSSTTKRESERERQRTHTVHRESARSLSRSLLCLLLCAVMIWLPSLTTKRDKRDETRRHDGRESKRRRRRR